MPVLWADCLQGTWQLTTAFPVGFGCSSSLQNQRGATGVSQQVREHSITGAAAQCMDTAQSTSSAPSGQAGHVELQFF